MSHSLGKLLIIHVVEGACAAECSSAWTACVMLELLKQASGQGATR